MFLGNLIQIFAQGRAQSAARRHELSVADRRDQRERRDQTLARLRELYVEALDVALAATPTTLGLRVSSEKAETIGEWEDRRDALAARTNAVRSRLVLETDAKADEILGELVGVVNGSKVYEMEAAEARESPERLPPGELAKQAQQVREAYRRLGALCREHLEALEVNGREIVRTRPPDET
ncbi:MAG: hypothetical protein ACRDGT_02455 [Candidatus Limnocylindria bacterium]